MTYTTEADTYEDYLLNLAETATDCRSAASMRAWLIAQPAHRDAYPNWDDVDDDIVHAYFGGALRSITRELVVTIRTRLAVRNG